MTTLVGARGSSIPEEHEREDTPMIRSSNEERPDSTQSEPLKPVQPVQPAREGKRIKNGKAPLKKSTNRLHTFYQLLTHIPALAITATILLLNFRNVYWGMPSSNTNNILNLLQFAAQLHASLMIASLSAMLLYLVQRGLASKQGVPLGFIGASFQLDSVPYLFRKEFTSLNLRYKLLFACALCLAISAGPSSAIVMIPRLQFWSMDNLWVSQGNMEFSVYVRANQTSLYPETLTAEIAAPQCSWPNASILSECPSYGVRQWLLDDDLFAYSPGKYSQGINKTVQGDWIRYVIGQNYLAFRGIQSSYSSSSLSNFLGKAMISYRNALSRVAISALGVSGGGTIQDSDDNLRARYDLTLRSAGKEIPTRKPVVQTECTGHAANATSFYLPHDLMMWPPWSSDPIRSTKWSIPASGYSSLSLDLNSTVVNSSWINSGQFGEIRPSLGVIFATPEIYHLAQPGAIKEPYGFFTCTIDARWMETKTYLNTAIGDTTVYDSNPNPEGAMNSYVFDDTPLAANLADLPVVYIEDSWANLLNVPWIDSLAHPKPTNRTILDTLGQNCLDKNTIVNATILGRNISADGLKHRIVLDAMNILQCMQVSLAVYFSDAIARAHDSLPVYVVAEGHVKDSYFPDPGNIFWVHDLYDSSYYPGQSQFKNISKADFQDPNKFVEIRMPVSRWGYGYGFQDSKLIYVGVVILLLNVVLSVSYMAWIVSMGMKNDHSWRSFGELMVMAMRSGSMDEDGHLSTINEEKTNSKKLWTETFRTGYPPSESNIGVGSGSTTGRRTVVLRRASSYRRPEDTLA